MSSITLPGVLEGNRYIHHTDVVHHIAWGTERKELFNILMSFSTSPGVLKGKRFIHHTDVVHHIAGKRFIHRTDVVQHFAWVAWGK